MPKEYGMEIIGHPKVSSCIFLVFALCLVLVFVVIVVVFFFLICGLWFFS